MKTCFPLSVIFLFSATLLLAQPITKEYGKISLSDFDYEFAGDTAAAAIVLFDIGTSQFVRALDGNGYDIQFVRKKRIFIKKKAGLTYADISIPFYVDGRGQTEKTVSYTHLTLPTILLV